MQLAMNVKWEAFAMFMILHGPSVFNLLPQTPIDEIRFLPCIITSFVVRTGIVFVLNILLLDVLRQPANTVAITC